MTVRAWWAFVPHPIQAGHGSPTIFKLPLHAYKCGTTVQHTVKHDITIVFGISKLVVSRGSPLGSTKFRKIPSLLRPSTSFGASCRFPTAEWPASLARRSCGGPVIGADVSAACGGLAGQGGAGSVGPGAGGVMP